MGETKVINKLKWKGEITFEGTIEQFSTFRTAIEKQPVRIGVAELEGKILPNIPRAGYIPAFFNVIFNRDQLEKLTEGVPRMQFKSIEGIAGGIRTPHLHLGDEVVLLDKERFKAILGEVARSITQQRVDTEEDYCNMIKSIITE